MTPVDVGVEAVRRADVNQPTTHPSTLLVCTANICRSPMAEALWRHAASRVDHGFPVASAGIEAQPGRSADPICVDLLAERGIDLTEHRAARLSPESAMRHELVLVMEPEHQRRILAAVPALAGRVHLLGRWGAGPIEDPYGASRAEYEHCLGQLEFSVMAWLDRIFMRRDATRI
jgi:protein-tyrosine-phosphatase